LALVWFYLVHLHQMRAGYVRTVRRCVPAGRGPRLPVDRTAKMHQMRGRIVGNAEDAPAHLQY
jgi:hypothetical protein